MLCHLGIWAGHRGSLCEKLYWWALWCLARVYPGCVPSPRPAGGTAMASAVEVHTPWGSFLEGVWIGA